MEVYMYFIFSIQIQEIGHILGIEGRFTGRSGNGVMVLTNNGISLECYKTYEDVLYIAEDTQERKSGKSM